MTPASITQWLKQPQTRVDPEAIESLLKAYPYFVPGRYLEAAHLHRNKPFSAPMLSGMQLYTANWLQFYQLMSAAREENIWELSPQPTETGPATGLATEPAPTTLVPISSLAESDSPILQPEAGSASQEESADWMTPVFTEDYFRHQGLQVAEAIPEELEHAGKGPQPEDPQSLMVVMSFSEWLQHFKVKSKKEKEEEQDRKALRTMWQKEKLAAAQEEENEEIPENVFEMAINSITKEDDLISESLAEIMVRQGKLDKAIEMYRKLGLRNPQKSGYFAQQIALIQKNSEA